MTPPDAHRLVLASASPRRRELLARLGLDPEVRPASVDETPRAGEAPEDLALRLARAKAADVAAGLAPGRVALAADTVVALHGESLGKPTDDAHAAAMLRRLSGRVHRVLTGVAAARGDEHHHALVATDVRMRELSEDEIAWYLATGESAGKAGGYALQGAGAALVAGIDGSDTSVIGLPLAETVVLLRRLGLDLLAPDAARA